MHRKLDISHLNPKTVFNNTFSNNAKDLKQNEEIIDEEIKIMEIAVAQNELHGDLI